MLFLYLGYFVIEYFITIFLKTIFCYYNLVKLQLMNDFEQIHPLEPVQDPKPNILEGNLDARYLLDVYKDLCNHISRIYDDKEVIRELLFETAKSDNELKEMKRLVEIFDNIDDAIRIMMINFDEDDYLDLEDF